MGAHRWSSLSLVLAMLTASVGVGVLAAPAAVAAGTQESYSITFVARVCPRYDDIMANLARNNIQESLRDLGKDTVYKSGQPITPSIEAANNPHCVPLDGWKFALGTGYTGKTPSTDYLSTITGDYGQDITVQPSVPELGPDGTPTGRTLADAVTVTLTDAQAQRAQQANKLWVQGGTKADPLLNNLFPGAYGFGALRCAIDNLNGDNVEWVGYPSGARHVFCYYYAVQPPPSAGTIVVRKQLQSGTNGPASFRFVGNISYTTTNDFTLTPQSDTQPASSTFIRAAGDLWDFEEQPTSGFTQVSLTCSQTVPPVSGPASTWTTTGRKAVVKVGDGATVLCVYVNKDVPPPTGELRLNKVTFGDVGSFPFKVTDPGGATTKALATTTAEGKADVVLDTPSGTAGTWTARETLPAPTSAGTWEATSVQCNGSDVAFTASDGPDGTTYVTARRTIASKETVDCTFANTFTPGGEIVLEKRTTGGVGSFSFPVVRQDTHPQTGDLFTVYDATTTTAGDVVTASPSSGQRRLSHLPVGQGAASTYLIGELSPPDTTTASWNLTGVTCTDLVTDLPVTGSVVRTEPYLELTLTDAHPRVRCLFDNELVENGTTPTNSTVLVTKTIEGRQAGRQGRVVIDLRCADGSAGSFVVPAGTTGKTGMTAPFVVQTPTSCTVTESATGANAGAELTETTMQVGKGPTLSTRAVTFTTQAEKAVVVAVTDVYGGLAPSGASGGTAAYALLGLLLVGTGGGLLVLVRRA